MLSKGNCKIGIQTCLDAIIAQLNEAFQDEEIKQQEIVQPEVIRFLIYIFLNKFIA